MRESEALVIAGLVEAYWRGMAKAKQAVWVEELTRLDFETARNAVMAMGRKLVHPPSVADFLGYYRDEAQLHPATALEVHSAPTLPPAGELVTVGGRQFTTTGDSWKGKEDYYIEGIDHQGKNYDLPLSLVRWPR